MVMHNPTRTFYVYMNNAASNQLVKKVEINCFNTCMLYVNILICAEILNELIFDCTYEVRYSLISYGLLL